MASDQKEPYVLLGLYQNLYKEKYNKAITLNRYKEKWAMQDVIDSVGFDRARDLLVYYFSLNKYGHPIQFFYFNFDKMEQIKIESDKDKEARRKLMEQTKKMVEEGGL